ncbi:hypothetical protein [Streptomyces lutosisoli]|uniref:IclR-ED domain-containing protein n=1 Tax=Streptomyces lutosisoli TaxID=2665721 RepID=A0ABW2VGE8_9ACTN
MTVAGTVAAGISLSVPDSWWEFDIRPEGRDATIRALIDQRTREIPELAPYRADLTNMLRKMAKDAHDSGAVYMGCMAENFDGVPLSATVTVSVLGAKDKQAVALSTDPRAIAETLRTITPRRDGDAWRTVRPSTFPKSRLLPGRSLSRTPTPSSASSRSSTTSLPRTSRKA